MRPINTFFYLMCYIPDNEFIWAYIEMLFRSLHSQCEHTYITDYFARCCVSFGFLCRSFSFVLNNEKITSSKQMYIRKATIMAL